MHGFDFMAELVKDMVQDDPSKCPTREQVVARFEEGTEYIETSLPYLT
jgi:hypothetical protein